MKVFLVVLIIAGIVGAFVWYRLRPTPIDVTIAGAEIGAVQATVSNTRVGTVKACQRAKMSPAAAGQVASLSAYEGQVVTRDTVLLEIWNEDLKAEARLVESEAKAAQRRAEEVCATAAGARRESARLERLAKRKLVAEETVDNARTQATATTASCAAARAQIDVITARAEVVFQQIEKTLLRAPFDGVVAEVTAKLGEFLTPSPPGIATLPAIDLIDLGCLYVSAPIDEVDAARIQAGLSACVSLDAFTERRCGARVKRVAPYVLDLEKQARTVEIEVEFTDPDQGADLLPGYSADIEILLEEQTGVLRIPSSAVFDGHYVLLRDPHDGTLTKRSVELGIVNWEYSAIRAGLKSGDQVVTSIGREGVHEGALTRIETP